MTLDSLLQGDIAAGLQRLINVYRGFGLCPNLLLLLGMDTHNEIVAFVFGTDFLDVCFPQIARSGIITFDNMAQGCLVAPLVVL